MLIAIAIEVTDMRNAWKKNLQLTSLYKFIIPSRMKPITIVQLLKKKKAVKSIKQFCYDEEKLLVQ